MKVFMDSRYSKDGGENKCNTNFRYNHKDSMDATEKAQTV